MTDWVRLWHDMPTDPKWRVIARKSGQSIATVIAVFNFVMINASANAAERGTLSGFDCEDVAAALDIEAADVEAVMDAMQGKVLDGYNLTGWQKRQPKREDSSADRVRSFRERNAKKRSVTQCNANETTRNAPETETETETETESSGSSLRSEPAADDEPPQDRFWSLAPAAEKAGISRSQLGQLANVLAGDFIRAIGVVQDSMAAKTPRVYFARIVANLKSERAEPDGETYRRPGDPKHVPAWVLERREAGADIRWKPPDRWVWGNEEYDENEELRAA